MKKSTRPALRAKALDAKQLEATTGGRGQVYGYTKCVGCGNITAAQWDKCANCGKPFETYRSQTSRN